LRTRTPSSSSRRTPFRGGPGQFGQRNFQAAGGIQMITGPDNPNRDRAGSAALAPQVMANCVDEPSIGRGIVGERLGHIAAAV
jgi:hypothetical protein